ncbi:hypothetical protein ACJRO7_028217 [Eucalyptus globulus]|uniref:Endoplasmic reticulum transmembrane protein n=1 Tax=Eucalyptus globulus TaxID=34317 RepID=A0ABD3JUI7_EUCGL
MLGNVAAMEVVMLFLLTAPGLDVLRRVLSSFTRGLLKPLLSVYETRPGCELESPCPLTVRLRHQKSVLKSQRNALLIGAAMAFYWLLCSVARMVVKIEQLNQHLAPAQGPRLERFAAGSGNRLRVRMDLFLFFFCSWEQKQKKVFLFRGTVF